LTTRIRSAIETALRRYTTPKAPYTTTSDAIRRTVVPYDNGFRDKAEQTEAQKNEAVLQQNLQTQQRQPQQQ
jgi:hypothetical protein